MKNIKKRINVPDRTFSNEHSRNFLKYFTLNVGVSMELCNVCRPNSYIFGENTVCGILKFHCSFKFVKTKFSNDKLL